MRPEVARRVARALIRAERKKPWGPSGQVAVWGPSRGSGPGGVSWAQIARKSVINCRRAGRRAINAPQSLSRALMMPLICAPRPGGGAQRGRWALRFLHNFHSTPGPGGRGTRNRKWVR